MRRHCIRSRRARTKALLVVLLGVLLGASGMSIMTPGASAARAENRPAAETSPAYEVVERWRKATPTERRAMREASRERWRAASPAQRRRMARRLRALERALPEFNSIERLILVRAVIELPVSERVSLRRRLRRIDDLEPAERDRLVTDLRQLIADRGPEIDRLERNRRRWEGLSEPEREEVREQMRRWREMTLEERRRWLEQMKTEQERQR